ncbi:MAG: hypothetical protein HETSPECPRED_004595, partial [Heterodermia speciosa]
WPFVEMTDEPNKKNKEKTSAQSEFSATKERDLIVVDDVEQQLSVSTAKESNQTTEDISVADSDLPNDDDVDYEALLAEKKRKIKRLKAKRQYEILQKRNKKLLKLLRVEEVALSLRRDRVRKTLESDFEFSNSFFGFSFETETSRRKKQRSFLVLKSTNLNNYHDKNFKKYQN